jgi:lipopolysaccharide export system protein LptA
MRLLILMLALLLSTPAAAQEQPVIGASSDQPLEITADEALEWHRNDQTFIARVNAVAKQGDVTISSATLTANYREGAEQDMEIWRVTAEDDVTIKSQNSTASGDHAVYDIDAGTAVMTGDDLKLISPDQTVTAKEKFEYWVTDGKLIATGNAKAVRPKPQGGQDTLEAAQITAIFADNAAGERALNELKADGNVVITTATEVVTGDHGTYNAATNLATLTGNVKIRRGPNELKGEKAQVDMNTNVSTMLGGGNITTDGSGRVRGIFYPGSDKKPEISGQTQ